MTWHYILFTQPPLTITNPYVIIPHDSVRAQAVTPRNCQGRMTLPRPSTWLVDAKCMGQFQQVELFHRSMNLLDAAVLNLYYVNSSQENCPLHRLWTDFRGKKKKKKSSNYLRQEIIAVFCFYLWEENTKSPKTLRTKKNISDDYNHPVRSVVSCFKMFSLCSMKIRWQVCSINRMLWQKTWRLLFERETVLTF